MGGSTRFELTSGNPEGSAFAATYPHGQRSNYAATNLDRLRSFREGMENRLLSSGPGSPQGSNTLSANMPSLSQCLMLEPIMLGDQKFTRAGELRRALGVNFGNTSEDHTFGAVHSKAPPVAIDELKRFKASIFDACNKARERVKTLNDSIVKLDEYCEALNSRKKQRSELASSERSGGTNLLKMGAQIHQKLVTQRLEERTKNAINKRVRTSVAESEGRNSTLSRQAGFTDKDRDVLRAGNGVQVEERVRGLPAAGEGWDKKMKRKRSVGIVVTRAMDGDREVKRATLQKLNSDPRPRFSDAHGFRYLFFWFSLQVSPNFNLCL
ncbi:uncharacterized protein LOC122063602 isoform X2 [Macadamia integrifolia]|uniref:uncharacterized protein LOC122063602 isoform X2 n=1 Tax=Macadamia integrifolia TaxID=60698 RepID=UPI001C4EC91A|nr:uncharacterized protein LOC122063602 isoform X2 [Macadamia integrifolia]